MASSAIDNRSEGKQFRLLKYFAWASFAVMVIFSFPFSVFISQKAKETLLKSYENSALLVGEHLNNQVFLNFVIPVINRYGKIKLSDQEQYELMDRVVMNTIQAFKVELVNIYDIGKGVVAYSTDKKLIGRMAMKTEGYDKAVLGHLSSGLILSGVEIWGVDLEIMGGKRRLRTYIPFTGTKPTPENPGYVAGVFELIQDLSTQYQSVVNFQYLVFTLSILIMGLIFFALLLIVHKAEKVIEQRAREQRELEEQLHQAERLVALGQMVAGISHEIKNPLGIIQSTAELLGGMRDASETQKRLSGVIREESVRLNRIVTEFLDFARPQTPRFREVHVAELLKKNLTFLRPELERRGIVVTHNLDGKSFPVQGDQDLLYRAFLNIFINSMQAIEGEGRINVDVQDPRDFCIVEIEDSGCGITKDNLKRIFNPFFTTKEKGTGLGLSIVKKIIEGHRGSMSIESAEGKGTKVRIQLSKT
jgi:two-component system, NtrC family, sensor histidine kinase HydH